MIVLSQQYVWHNISGNQDFFDENNWIDTGAFAPSFSIEPNQGINLNLFLNCESYANATIKIGSVSLNIMNGTLFAKSIAPGVINIYDLGYLHITDSVPLQTNTQINFFSPISALKIISNPPLEVYNNYLSLTSANQMPANFPNNVRLDNYYATGTVIRPNDSTASALSVFSQDSLGGYSSEIIVE